MSEIDGLIDKIHFGDAYDLIKQIPDASVDMIYTDIPYLQILCGGGRNEIANRAKEKANSLNDISKGINYSIFDDFIRVCKKLNLFIWCSNLQIPEILNYFVSRGFMFNILVWCKTNPMPTVNNLFLPDLEYCLYFRETGVRLNDGYDLKSKWSLSAINQKDKAKFLHPTIKPLELVSRHILHATKEGDIVLDPFIGSGTTAVAAKMNGRRYIGFENNKQWYDIAVNRLNGIQADGQMSFLAM
jgi:DNA modification methylase